MDENTEQSIRTVRSLRLNEAITAARNALSSLNATLTDLSEGNIALGAYHAQLVTGRARELWAHLVAVRAIDEAVGTISTGEDKPEVPEGATIPEEAADTNGDAGNTPEDSKPEAAPGKTEVKGLTPDEVRQQMEALERRGEELGDGTSENGSTPRAPVQPVPGLILDPADDDDEGSDPSPFGIVPVYEP